MSKHLIELIHTLSDSKRQAYARQDQQKIEMIEARIADFCERYQFSEIEKACPVLWRSGPNGPQILAFHHPSAGDQLVKGGLESEESPAAAARRELQEEAGIAFSGALERLGVLHHMLPAGPAQNGPLEHQRWHIFLAQAPDGLAENWSHAASGSPEEDGLVFELFWQDLHSDFEDRAFHPIFIQVMHLVSQHLSPESAQVS